MSESPSPIPISCPATPRDRETVLEPGDLITHVTLPPPVAGSKQVYLKLRDRASYEFALASAAVVLTVAVEMSVTSGSPSVELEPSRGARRKRRPR